MKDSKSHREDSIIYIISVGYGINPVLCIVKHIAKLSGTGSGEKEENNFPPQDTDLACDSHCNLMLW